MLVLYGFLLWLLFGQAARLNNFFEFVVVVVAAAVALIYVILSRHPITRLRIGPKGISAPYGIIRRIAWDEVDRVEYQDLRSIMFPRRDVLVVSFKPGIPQVAKVPLPEFAEDWLHRRGLRVPLNVLRDPLAEVLNTVEQYAHGLETDLQSEAVNVGPAE